METLSERIKPVSARSNSLFSLVYIGVFVSLWTLTVLTKGAFDFAHYHTVDGNYYTTLSQKIVHHQPFVIDGLQNSSGRSFSPYPPGFPFLLAMAGQATRLPGFWAALILHGFLFFLLGIVWRKSASFWTLAAVFTTDTAFELATYPWSEFSFICILILIALVISGFEREMEMKHWFILAVLAFLCILIRYAGIFLVIFLGLKWLISLIHKENRVGFWIKTAIAFLSLTTFWSLAEWLWFGQITGGDRYPNAESSYILLKQLALACTDQVLIFKDFSGSSLASFLFATSLFVFMIGWILFGKTKREPPASDFNPLVLNLALLGVSYLLFMIPLRWYFYFAEPFDFRLLGPGFILILLSVFTSFNQKYRINRPILFMIAWFGICLFFTLPKAQIFVKYQEFIWLHP